MTNQEAKLANVVSLETQGLNDADLHKLVLAVTELANSKATSNSGSDALIAFLEKIEAEFYTRMSDTPSGVLRKIVCLASDTVESNYSYGPALMVNAAQIIEGMEGRA